MYKKPAENVVKPHNTPYSSIPSILNSMYIELIMEYTKVSKQCATTIFYMMYDPVDAIMIISDSQKLGLKEEVLEKAKMDIEIINNTNINHIDLVVEQTLGSYLHAARALHKANGDIVNAIMEITLGINEKHDVEPKIYTISNKDKEYLLNQDKEAFFKKFAIDCKLENEPEKDIADEDITFIINI